MARSTRRPGILAILLHTIAVFLTGGIWGVVLIVAYLVRRAS